MWKQVIRAYSALTGDFVKEFEPAENKIVGISLLPDQEEKNNVIVGCTDTGEIIQWNITNGLIIVKNVREQSIFH